MKFKNKDKLIFNIIGYLIIGVIAIICIIPFELILVSSFASAESLNTIGYAFIPKGFSLDSYIAVFRNPISIINAYKVTILSTCIGTALALFLTSMTSYVLWRKDFRWRNQFSFFFYFTTLFSGGLVPWYILCVQYLKLKEMPLAAVIVPYLFNVFNIIIIRSFMKNIPEAIVESAKIDGAGDFKIFLSLILPLSKPALASIGLFIALAYWNDWFLSFLFVSNSKDVQLQYYLYKMISTNEVIKTLALNSNVPMANLPTEGMRMAMTIIVIGPIVLLYPFLQKYFVGGLTIGAVKG